MGVTIRLARHGRHKAPFYRIVVADKEYARDGRFIERVGTLNPLTDPQTVELKADRVKHWVGLGAVPSDRVGRIINQEIPGYLEEIEQGRLDKLQAKRKARKSAGKGKAADKSEAKARRKARALREKPVQVAKTEDEPAAEEAPAEETPVAEAAPAEETPPAEEAPAEEAPKEE